MHDEPFPPPIFVLGAPGMPGPTLAAALGRNPAAWDVPELNLEMMATVDVLQRELIGIRAAQLHGLMRALAQLLGGEQTAAAVEMAQRFLIRHAWQSTDTVARSLAARIAPRRMVRPVTAALFDKASLRRLRATFPGGHFVTLHLHPRAYGTMMWNSTPGQVALQLTGALDTTTDPPTPDPQELWLMAETALTDLLGDLPPAQVASLQIEDLLADPDAALAGLASALGLPADPAAVAAMRHPEASPFAGPGPMGAHSRSAIGTFAALAESLAESLAPEMSQEGPKGLEGALAWRPDAATFRPEVRTRARALGYV